jgi:hypothetical protein
MADDLVHLVIGQPPVLPQDQLQQRREHRNRLLGLVLLRAFSSLEKIKLFPVKTFMTFDSITPQEGI